MVFPILGCRRLSQYPFYIDYVVVDKSEATVAWYCDYGQFYTVYIVDCGVDCY
jgi:hypothetical protein